MLRFKIYKTINKKIEKTTKETALNQFKYVLVICKNLKKDQLTNKEYKLFVKKLFLLSGLLKKKLTAKFSKNIP